MPVAHLVYLDSLYQLRRHQEVLFWEQLQCIRHDDIVVGLADPVRMRAPLGANARGGLLTLTAFDSCHTLDISSTKVKPVILSPCRPLHVRSRWCLQSPHRWCLQSPQRFHHSLPPLSSHLSRKVPFAFWKKKFHCVTGDRDSINLVSIFRCSSSPSKPVYERHVDSSPLGFSLSSHQFN